MDLTLANVLVTVGQLLLGALYVWAGLNHFGPAGEKVVPLLAARGLPMPRELLYVASVFELVCGACLMLGMISTWWMFVVKAQNVEVVFKIARVVVPLGSVVVMLVACFF